MTTGLGATFTIEGNPGKDVGTAKTVLQKLVVLAICAFVLAIVNPRMVGFISLCINFRWYFLLTSRTSAPIEQNVVQIALELDGKITKSSTKHSMLVA